MEGLEPPRITPPDPKSGAAANYATCADYITNKRTLFYSDAIVLNPHGLLHPTKQDAAANLPASRQVTPHAPQISKNSSQRLQK